MKPRYLMCYKKPDEEKWHAGAITAYNTEACGSQTVEYMRKNGYQYKVEIWNESLTEMIDEVTYGFNN